MTATADKQPPVELSRYEFERLATFISKTGKELNSLGGRQLQFTNRINELQDLLYLNNGRYERFEHMMQRQNQKLEAIRELLDRLVPANGQ